VLGASSFHQAPGLVRQADNGYGVTTKVAEKIGLHSILVNGALVAEFAFVYCYFGADIGRYLALEQSGCF
jgi:hypothetical protein